MIVAVNHFSRYYGAEAEKREINQIFWKFL